jgi:hypothetical protein
MFSTFIKNVLLAPLLILATGLNLFSIFLIVKDQSLSSSSVWFLAGFIAGFVTFKFICRFEVVYVFGHETAHWLAAKICRKKTGKFSFGFKSGSVEVEKPNTFIMLAPYFFPTLTVAMLPLYFLLPLLKHQEQADIVFTFVIGSSFAHHIYMNARLIIKTKQSDFDKPGHFFSATLLSYINTFIVFCIFVFFTPSFSNIKTYFQAINKISQEVIKLIQ